MHREWLFILFLTSTVVGFWVFTQLHTLQHMQELLLWLFHFELFQNLVKVCTHWKSYQASWSILIDLDAQYVSSFTEVFIWKTPFKYSFMLSRKFYIIFDQQYVIHIYYQKGCSAPTHFL